MEELARLVLVGRLLETAVHQLAEPVATIAAASHLLFDRAGDQRIRSDLEQIRLASGKLSRVLATLARLSGTESGARGIVDLSRIAAEALELLGSELWARGVSVRVAYADEPARVVAVPGLLLEAALHLLAGSLEALAKPRRLSTVAGQITVRTAVSRGRATLTVAHERLPEGPAEATGEPDRTTSTISLDPCRAIAEALGGAVQLDPADAPAQWRAGGAVHLRLPLAGAAADGEPTPAAG